MPGSDFIVTFLGVGGSSALSRPERTRYGANTSCVLLEAGGRPLILDMGTGLVKLRELRQADILLSHYHLDHIEGMPFFEPLYTDGQFDVYGRSYQDTNIRSALSGLLRPPYLPITPSHFRAEVRYHDIGRDSFTTTGGLDVDTIALDHPDGCLGFRIHYGGRSVAYVIDHERTGEEEARFCEGADLMIYDAHFTAAEYESGRYTGWGHSHHEAGLALAQAAGARRIVFVHHAIWRTDDELDALAAGLSARFAGAVVGKEDMRIEL